MDIFPTRLNEQLSEALQNRSFAEAFLLKGRTNFWRLLAAGSVMLGLGVATGVGFAGYAQVLKATERTPNFSSILASALRTSRLQGVVQGTVQITPKEIALAKNQTVEIDPKSRLLLDPAARITAEGEVRLYAPTISLPKIAGDSPTRNPTITNFTVFKSIPFEKGVVMTGWSFLTSAQRTPSDQYCYFTESSDTPGLNVVVDIASNQKMESRRANTKGFNFDEAFERCVWFKSQQ